MCINKAEDWPAPEWQDSKQLPLLAEVRHKQQHLLGRMEGLGFRFRAEVKLNALASHVIKSFAIEGERLDTEQGSLIHCSYLGIEYANSAMPSRSVEG